MKVKVSISMEEDTLKEVKEEIIESIFRNQSHFIEHAVNKYLKEVKNGNSKIN